MQLLDLKCETQRRFIAEQNAYNERKSYVTRQLNDLGSKRELSFQPVFLSKKLEDELKITEKRPSIVNQQHVVWHKFLFPLIL